MRTSNKIDGVVEAVRYAPDGQVALVRVYERRGPAFGDRVLLDRGQLLARLKAGKRFVAGRRKPLWGASFETGADIRLVQDGGSDFVRSAQASGTADDLKGVPLF